MPCSGVSAAAPGSVVRETGRAGTSLCLALDAAAVPKAAPGWKMSLSLATCLWEEEIVGSSGMLWPRLFSLPSVTQLFTSDKE